MQQDTFVSHLIELRQRLMRALLAVLAAKSGDPLHLVRETADLWFHGMILLARRGLGPGDVLAELHRREGIPGLDEKAARKK